MARCSSLPRLLATRAWSAVAAAALVALGALPSGAAADGGLPLPVIDHALQARPVVYDAQLRQLDSNGRFELDLLGTNLGPDDYAHPGGFEGGYVHLYVRGRGTDRSRPFSAWKRCDDDDCRIYGGTSRSGIAVGLNPGFFLNQPQATLQFRVWVSLGATMSDDPATAQAQASDWSPVFEVNRARAGEAPPAPPPETPTIDRLGPDPLVIVPGQAGLWTLSVFGRYYSTPQLRAIFQGDRAHPVAPNAHAMGIDDAGHPLPAGQSLAHFDLPEGLRRPGIYTVTIDNGSGESAPARLVVKAMDVQRVGGPARLAPAVNTLAPRAGAAGTVLAPARGPATPTAASAASAPMLMLRPDALRRLPPEPQPQPAPVRTPDGR